MILNPRTKRHDIDISYTICRVTLEEGDAQTSSMDAIERLVKLCLGEFILAVPFTLVYTGLALGLERNQGYIKKP